QRRDVGPPGPVRRPALRAGRQGADLPPAGGVKAEGRWSPGGLYFSVHMTGWGWISSAGRGAPAFRAPPGQGLVGRTVMSWSKGIWQLRRTPDSPRAARTVFSATVIRSGSPARNSTRQVVQRALPPQAWS